jgi:hypothetical protein
LGAELSDRELRLLRMRSQGLLPGSGAGSVAGATSTAFCIQAQDVAAASLAIRARTEGLTAAGVARQGRGKAVCRAWLMRNTIHLFRERDLAWMRPLLAERPRAPALRRLEQLGVGAARIERALEALRERLAAGPLPRKDAIELIKAQGVKPSDGNNAIYWVIHLAALEGVLVVRPALDRVQVFEPAPEPEPLDRDEGLGRLARRYLEANAPAGPRDLAYWAKITLGDARRGFEGAGRLTEVATSAGTLSALPRTLKPLPSRARSVRLLGLWDNFLLGHEDRELIVPKPATGWVRPGGGLLKPTAFADGRAFAVWRIERERKSLRIALEPIDALPRGVRPGLEEEVNDLGRFFEAEASLRVLAGS